MVTIARSIHTIYMMYIKFSFYFLFLGCCFTSLASTVVNEDKSKALPQRYYLNIPRSDAANVLNLLAQQTDAILIYPFETVKKKQANAIYGYFTLFDAIDYVLLNTGLKATLNDNGSIIISEAPVTQINVAVDSSALNTKKTSSNNNHKTEIIVIDGLRRSLLTALDIKKQSVAILDTVVSADIGKLPDKTAAESIAHISGVQVARSNDEVNTIIIRGLPYYTTTYNNRELFTGELRYSTLQDFPSATLDSIELYKPGTSELIEPGLAGLINIRTRRPFDLNGEKFSGNIHYSYNDQSEKLSPKGNLFYTNRWHTDLGDIGFLTNLTYSQSKYYNGTRYNSSSYNEVPAELVTAPDEYPDGGFIIPNSIGLFYKGGNRKRPSLNVAMQWQPTAALELYYDGLFQGYRSQISEKDFFIQMTNSDPLYGLPNLENVVLVQATNNRPVAKITKTGGVPPWLYSLASNAKTNTFQNAIGAKWHKHNIEIVTDLAFTKSNFSDDRWSVDTAINQPTTVDVDFFGDHGLTFNLPELAALNLNMYTFRGYFESKFQASGEGIQWRTDVKYTTNFPSLNTIKFGIRYTNRNAVRQDGFRYAGVLDLNKPMSEIAFLAIAPTANPLRNSKQIFTQYLAPSMESIETNHKQLSLLAFNALSELAERGEDWSWATEAASYWSEPDIPINNATNYSSLEKTYSFYLEGHFNVELASLDVDTIAGFRFVRTDSESSGISSIEDDEAVSQKDISTKNNYFDLMPSVITRIGFSEDLQLRLSYTQTLTRPAFNDLNPALNIVRVSNAALNETTLGIDAYGNAGNANLVPLTSENIDINLDYYFSDAGLISTAAFYKKLSGLLSRNVSIIEDPIYGTIELTRPENLDDGKIYGYEFNVQSFLDFLPTFWKQFGVTFNCTYLQGKSSNNEINTELSESLKLPNLSKWTYNAAIFFESESITARLSYNYRSPRINHYQQTLDNTYTINKTRSRDFLDLSIQYNINKHYTVYTDFRNILANPFRNYNQISDTSYYDIDVRDEGRYFGVGVRFNY